MRGKTLKRNVILGGGQLARMTVIQARQKLNMEIAVITDNPDDPAAKVATSVRLANTKNPVALKTAMRSYDGVRFGIESEFYRGHVLASALATNNRSSLFPSARNITLLQNRCRQKNALIKAGLPTARFVSITKHRDLLRAYDLFGPSFVLKQCLDGYDGKGTTMVRSEADYKKAQRIDFTDPVLEGYIAERLIDFRRELAFQAVRNASGEIVFFPLVETHQTNYQLDWLKGPIEHKELAGLQELVREFLHAIRYVGIIAFELFECDGKLMINEIAPRPHNSGHHSIDSCTTDQFTEYVRAMNGMPLCEPRVYSEFAMVNILGRSNNPIEIPKGVRGRVHLYDKKENRIGRKMGHTTLLGSSMDECLDLLIGERENYIL